MGRPVMVRLNHTDTINIKTRILKGGADLCPDPHQITLAVFRRVGFISPVAIQYRDFVFTHLAGWVIF